MKKISIVLSLAVVLLSCSVNSQNQLKRYNVESGIVKYKTTISGGLMGGTVTGGGTSELYFKDWGALELSEEISSQTTTMKMFGSESVETTESHTMKKLDNGESYTVNFEREEIWVSRDPMMDYMIQSGTDAGEAGQSMLESMGGTKIGEESFQGYNCEIWEIMGAKQWLHKGVMLKLEMSLMGITTITEATSVQFDISVSDANFELPDFAVQEMEGFMDNEEFQEEMDDDEMKIEQLQNLSFEDYKKMVIEADPDMKNASDEELRQTYNMMQAALKARGGN